MGELRIDRLSKTYARREGWNSTRYLRVFEDVSFTVHDGEFVSIIGSSGCGKSTLLSIAGGLSEPRGGAVHVDGRQVKGRGSTAASSSRSSPSSVADGHKYHRFGLSSKGLPKEMRGAARPEICRLVGLSGFETIIPIVSPAACASVSDCQGISPSSPRRCSWTNRSGPLMLRRAKPCRMHSAISEHDPQYYSLHHP